MSETLDALKKECLKLKASLECPVCLDTFTKPVKILPCLHSFCSSCLNQHASASASSSSSSLQGGHPKCPLCRRDFTVDPLEEGSTLDVKTNHFAHSQLDRLSEMRESVQRIASPSSSIEICDSCKPPKQRDAVIRCMDCQKNLCERHEESHAEFTQGHRVISLADLEDEPLSSKTIQPPASSCASHPSKVLDLFCLRCNIPICAFCHVGGAHKGHSSDMLSKVMERKKKQISTLIENVRNRKPEIEASLSLIDLMISEIHENTILQRDLIACTFECLQKSLEDRKNQLITELDEGSKSKLEKISQQRKEMEKDLECLDNSVSVSQSIVSNATDEQLALHQLQILRHLTRLSEDPNLLRLPVEATHLELYFVNPLDFSPSANGGQLVDAQSITIERAIKALPKSTRKKAIFDEEEEEETNSKEVSQSPSSVKRTGSVLFDDEDEGGDMFSSLKNVKISQSSLSFDQNDKNNAAPVAQSLFSDRSASIFDDPAPAPAPKRAQPTFCEEDEEECDFFGSSSTPKQPPASSSGSLFGGKIDGNGFSPILPSPKQPPASSSSSSSTPFASIWDDDEKPTKLSSSIKREKKGNQGGSRGLRLDGDFPSWAVSNFVPFSEATFVIGSKGSSNGCFNLPSSSTLLYTNIVICDRSNNRVQMFDNQGHFIMAFGSKGTANGMFKEPMDITVDRMNRIIVSDQGNNRIQVFDETGIHLKSFGARGSGKGQFKDVRGVAVNKDNILFVCDYSNNRIQLFDDGNFIGSFGSTGSGNGQFNNPRSVAIDSKERIIVCDSFNHRIQIFDHLFRHVLSFGQTGTNNGDFKFPLSVSVDGNDNIIVCDSGNHRVQIFNSNGLFISTFGSKGSGKGQFFNPLGLTASVDGSFIVCDRDNHRVQVF